MGGGTYSADVRCSTARYVGYMSSTSPHQVFKEKSLNSSMNPSGVKVRESRDSAEHPNSVAIILALDVTGSMGSIPHSLVKNGLPNIMESVIKAGIPDPQLLFMGIGDHECDQWPLQVGQFESSDELLDKWLTSICLEGGGGGNDGESYPLAWYFAGKHTAIDCFEKRGKRGILFTIGDEPALKNFPKSSLKEIMGDGQYDQCDALTLLDKAREKYDVYHVHVKQGNNGQRQEVMDGWKQLLGDHLLIAEDHLKIPEIIAETVKKHFLASSSSKVKLQENML